MLFVGRRSVSNADVEDEQFTAILTLIEILTNLLSKDFFSFAEGFACQLFSTYLVSCWACVLQSFVSVMFLQLDAVFLQLMSGLFVLKYTSLCLPDYLLIY